MENYFNRNNIKPLPYLQSPWLQPLQAIWVSFHHVPTHITPKSTPAIGSLTNISIGSSHCISEEIPNSQQIIEEKRRKVIEM